MAHSINRYTYTGGTDFDLSFTGGFRVRSDVTCVKIGEVEQDVSFDWLTDDQVRVVSSGLEVGDIIEFRRTVSKSEAPVDIMQPGNFTREAVVTAVTHTLQALQEVLDGRVDAFTGKFIQQINDYIAVAQDLLERTENALEQTQLSQAAAELSALNAESSRVLAVQQTELVRQQTISDGQAQVALAAAQVALSQAWSNEARTYAEEAAHYTGNPFEPETDFVAIYRDSVQFGGTSVGGNIDLINIYNGVS